jgi:predicted NBD/HSP70 family sugar kinase
MAQSGVRLVNERAILRLIAAAPGSSNADLARMSGLGAQTTSRIVSELEQRGLISRGQVLRGRRGQPATPLYIEPDSVYALGIELGWRHVSTVLVDLLGTVRDEVHVAIPYPDAETVFDTIIGQMTTICSRLTPEQDARIELVGLSSPSSLARNIDLVEGSTRQRQLWEGPDPARRLADRIGRDVAWFNDGNAACWAEFVAQPRPRPLNLVYFHIGTFVGGGVIADGNLLEGPNGTSANLGSIMVTDRDGKPTFVHQVASLWALCQLIDSKGLPAPGGLPMSWDWAGLEPAVSQWIDEASLAIAKAIVTSQAFVEFDRAVIDGSLPRPILERFISGVHEQLRLLPMLTTDRLLPQLGHLGPAASAVGAAELPLFRLYFERDWSHVSL